MTVQTTQDTVSVTIDGFEIRVPKGTLVIRAAEMLGIAIPRFCDHPLLDPIGACRQCLVEVEGQRKPLASCTTTCTEGMVARTQLTSAVAEKAQRGVMELLLINHPLDCPMCDKGGECPLQNQAMSSGQGETRFTEDKRIFEKPVAISTEVLLDRERCISCTRCVRTSEEIAGDAFIEFIERGPGQFIGTAAGKPFNSYFSGNTVQVCPVGALTGAAYRFRARPFDLVSVPSVCEHCASGCRQRTDVRRGRVTRRLAGDDPAVNEEWNCDKGRWAFTYATEPDRLTSPLVRDEAGVLVPASWPHALAVAAAGLTAARDADPLPGLPGPRGVGVLAGGILRGRFKSEGTFVMQRPPRDKSDPKSIDEGTDAYDTIDWLMKNVPKNNGRVGIWGISYPGWLVTQALLEPHPALKAASEQASPDDMFINDDFHHNGAFRLSYGFEYSALLESSKEKNTDFDVRPVRHLLSGISIWVRCRTPTRATSTKSYRRGTTSSSTPTTTSGRNTR